MTKNHPELKACELLPCPFPKIFNYGGLLLTYDGQGGIWRVSCSSCGTRGPIAKTKDEAVRLWNTRPSPIIPEDAVKTHTYESERDLLEKQVGKCCEGTSPLCSAGGCLVEKAIKKNNAESVSDDGLREAIEDARAFDRRNCFADGLEGTRAYEVFGEIICTMDRLITNA